MIKAIIFDLDDTLYSWKATHSGAMDKVAAYVRETLKTDPEEMFSFYKAEMKQMEAEIGKQAAIHSRLIRFLRFLEHKKLPLDHAQIMDRIYWHAVLDAAVPEPGCPEALAQLKQQGYILGMGTNMTLDWQLAKLSKLNLLQFFSFIVSSEEAGVEKPDARIFRMCAQRAGVAPEECLFIGDSLKGDVLGAENAGMQALWYAPAEADLSQHLGFTHFSQLNPLLSDLVI